MPPTTPALPDSLLTPPKTALADWARVESQARKWANLRWADTPEGGLLVDLVPNPKRYLIGTVAGVSVAMDCGEPGIHVGKATV